jgi:hypothetical protein
MDAPTMAKNISVDKTENRPPKIMGLPKSAMLSMKPTKKALAKPGFNSGSVICQKVCMRDARKVCEASSKEGRDALNHTAHDHEGNGREGKQLRQSNAKHAIEPTRGRNAESPLRRTD